MRDSKAANDRQERVLQLIVLVCVAVLAGLSLLAAQSVGAPYAVLVFAAAVTSLIVLVKLSLLGVRFFVRWD